MKGLFLMKKNDVLILCQYFHPEYVSSAVLPYQTAEDLVKKGFKVKVVCGYPKEYLEGGNIRKKEVINGIQIHRLKYLQLSRKSKIGRLINYFSFFLSVVFHWFLLVDNKCTIVYSNPPVLPFITSLNKKIFGIKYIFVSYDIYPDVALVTNQIRKDSFIHKMMTKINQMTDKTVDQVIALSMDMKDYLLQSRKSIAEEKITVVPNWYDDYQLNVTSDIKDKEISELRKKYKVIVLYSGNMGICQDMDTILEAAKRLKENKDIAFVFTGHGQKKESLEKQANDENLRNIIFYDFLKGEQYVDMLKAADCHIVSLESGIEGICVPSKTYSYMAIGRPLIAIMNSNTDIARDINEHGLGCAINPGDSKQLEKYILFLLSNPEKIKAISAKARSVYLEKYTRSHCTDKYYEVVERVINAEGVAGGVIEDV